MTPDPTPALKCVIAWSERRRLCDVVADALASLADDGQVLRLGEDAHVVSSLEPPDAIRDAVRGVLQDDEGLLVTAFETWSGFGKALDSTWLLRRGH